ncbi:hypothetical protein AA103196_0690 [Ameyamaea chiangmaiensis NBRC 103196]|uniref:CvpA family protein n=1 Tax=Ameyamaea chiangmaiensis TaxID=442969 RepID=A0A850PF29_9PROT|nr:CvpA family protein [Ameyamaea chiangmaiensis]MBS4075793.1 CvpA family protein [Ameyamaea chiangmaiensis]NVN40856.1 CvpA family protein [Ameyamaea chiangmaiensis]GBQ63762.1 hypothetical protein AA103196_0690 [Ameyamaea chiangmaiensis NBRC 103196]
MALVDILAVLVVAMSVLWGLMRGFSRELFGLLAWIVAFILASRWYGRLVPLIAPHVSGGALADVIAFALVFVVLVLLLSMVSALIGNAMQGSMLLGGANALLGGLFGVFRGVVLLVLLYAAGSAVMDDAAFAAAVHGSRIAPFIYRAALYLEGHGPVFVRVHLAPPDDSVHDPAI